LISAPFARIAGVLAVVAVLAGAYARLASPGRPAFYQDEASTALVVSGYGRAALEGSFDGRVHRASEIRRFIERGPAASVGVTMATLLAEDPQHASVFYAFDRLASDALGSSLAAYRAPSILFGLIAIALAYALGTQLFERRLGGAVLAALVAVSPLQVLYARQAREYALFSCTVLGASLLLVVALRQNGRTAWIAYAASVALGLYTDPVFIAVLLAHGVFVALELRREPRNAGAFLLAGAAGCVLYAPWAALALRAQGRFANGMSWGQSAYPLKFLLLKWAFNIGAVFFDAEFGSMRLAAVAGLAVALALAALTLVIAGRTDPLGRDLALPLIAIPALLVIAGDVRYGGHFATVPRYLFASWIGLEIAVASALMWMFRERRASGLAAFAFLVLAGAGSVLVDNRAIVWWDNDNDQIDVPAVAARITQQARPLVVSEERLQLVVMLAYYLPPETEMLLFRARPPALPARAALLLVPSAGVFAAIAAQTQGRATLSNVSPVAGSAIGSFRRDLYHAAPGAKRPERIDVSAGNALWLIEPRPPRTT
jgi:uncharacterized membrane protein